MTIEPFAESDRDAVHALLTASKLPIAGFDDHSHTALVARDEGRVVGSAALELYQPYALLRSVAVDERLRGRGLGQLLTAEALALARRHGVREVYLLTETAPKFFPKLGFTPVDRAAVPDAVKQSVEFTGACCVSALAMKLQLS